MNQTGSAKKLRDAIDLVRMLEHVTDGLSKKRQDNGQVPWAGMSLTLTRARELMSVAYEGITEGVRWEASDLPAEDEFLEPERQASGSIANRIRPVPASTGQVRELDALNSDLLD